MNSGTPAKGGEWAVEQQRAVHGRASLPRAGGAVLDPAPGWSTRAARPTPPPPPAWTTAGPSARRPSTGPIPSRLRPARFRRPPTRGHAAVNLLAPSPRYISNDRIKSEGESANSQHDGSLLPPPPWPPPPLAVETQGKGSVLAPQRQWKHKARAVSYSREGCGNTRQRRCLTSTASRSFFSRWASSRAVRTCFACEPSSI